VMRFSFFHIGTFLSPKVTHRFLLHFPDVDQFVVYHKQNFSW
jgi:hypothetical protein